MNRYDKNFLLSLQSRGTKVNIDIPFEKCFFPDESNFKFTRKDKYIPVKEPDHFNSIDSRKSKKETNQMNLLFESNNKEYCKKTTFQPKIKTDKNTISMIKSDFFTELYQVSIERTNLDPVKIFYIKLKALFKDQNDSNELILDRILTEFSASELNCREFCGALTVVLCKRCLKNDSFDTSLFILRIFLLRKFLSKEIYKLEALSALRCLDDKVIKPKNFLSHVFTLLYEHDTINFDLFLKWKKLNQKYQQSLNKLSDFF